MEWTVKEFDIGPLTRLLLGLLNVVGLIHIGDDGKVNCFSTSLLSLRETSPPQIFLKLSPFFKDVMCK